MKVTEIKNKIELTSEQKELVEELNQILHQVADAGVQLVIDASELAMGAFNGKHIKGLRTTFDHDWQKEAVDIENDVDWDIIDCEDIHIYESHIGNLAAVFE